MNITKEQQKEAAANKHVDLQYPMGVERQYPIDDFKAGAEWMEEQLEPIITEYGMNEIKLKEKIAELEPKWTNTNDKTPNENESVLVKVRNPIAKNMSYTVNSWCQFTNMDEERFIRSFEAWIALPEPTITNNI